MFNEKDFHNVRIQGKESLLNIYFLFTVSNNLIIRPLKDPELNVCRCKSQFKSAYSTPATHSRYLNPSQPRTSTGSLIQKRGLFVTAPGQSHSCSLQYSIYFAPPDSLLCDNTWGIPHRQLNPDVGFGEIEAGGLEQAVTVRSDVLCCLGVSGFET